MSCVSFSNQQQPNHRTGAVQAAGFAAFNRFILSAIQFVQGKQKLLDVGLPSPTPCPPCATVHAIPAVTDTVHVTTLKHTQTVCAVDRYRLMPRIVPG